MAVARACLNKVRIFYLQSLWWRTERWQSFCADSKERRKGPALRNHAAMRPMLSECFFLTATLLLIVETAHAQLAVTVSPVKVTGQKAIVLMTMENNFAEIVESARAVVFLLDEQGKMLGQATRWVIGSQTQPGSGSGLRSEGTNAFHFVIASEKPFTTTNLTAKVSFSRVVMAGGRMVDVGKEVVITSVAK